MVAPRLNFSYADHGKISGGNFISETDYKTFAKVFGEASGSVDVRAAFQADFDAALAKYRSARGRSLSDVELGVMTKTRNGEFAK
ncbi:hypothetical protein D3C72_1973240 [compost metagenome]